MDSGGASKNDNHHSSFVKGKGKGKGNLKAEIGHNLAVTILNPTAKVQNQP